MNIIQCKSRRAQRRRRNTDISIFRLMSPAESRQARAVAFEAALAVIG